LDHERGDDDDENPAFPVDEIPPPPLVSPALVEDLLQAQPDPSLVDRDLEVDLEVDDKPVSPVSESISQVDIQSQDKDEAAVLEADLEDGNSNGIHIHPIMTVLEPLPHVQDPMLPVEEPVPTITEQHLPLDEPLPPTVEMPEPARDTDEPLPPRIEIPEPALDALPVDGGVRVAPPVTAPLRRSPRLTSPLRRSPRLATIPKVCYKRFYRLRP
jgi:hypothetical protein